MASFEKPSTWTMAMMSLGARMPLTSSSRCGNGAQLARKGYLFRESLGDVLGALSLGQDMNRPSQQRAAYRRPHEPCGLAGRTKSAKFYATSTGRPGPLMRTCLMPCHGFDDRVRGQEVSFRVSLLEHNLGSREIVQSYAFWDK
jgi:hypothetical protein